jgi:hypothetical protein
MSAPLHPWWICSQPELRCAITPQDRGHHHHLDLGSISQAARYAFKDVRVVAHADNVRLQGPPPSAVEAFRLLVNATALIGLAPSLPKCTAYATGSAIASALGVTHRPDKHVAAGTPLSSDVLVEADPRSQAETVAGLVVTLAALFLVDQPLPENLPADPVVAQLTLPLRFRGFGLRVTTSLEAGTAFLAAAGTAEIALRSTLAPFWPFHLDSPLHFPHMPIGNAPQRSARPLVWACPGTQGNPPWPHPGGCPAVVRPIPG